MNPTTKLRRLLSENRCIIAPGVADALAARLVAREGFEAIYMTGFGTSLTRLGMPDVGLLTATEMVDNASRIADASGLPLVADADTGYGNALNVMRTVNDRERAGIAAICIEDNVYPKRCSFYAGVRRGGMDGERDAASGVEPNTDATHGLAERALLDGGCAVRFIRH